MAIEGVRDVHQNHVAHPVRPRVGHGTGDRVVQRRQNDLRRRRRWTDAFALRPVQTRLAPNPEAAVSSAICPGWGIGW